MSKGIHLCKVLQVTDLLVIIIREFECRKHLYRPGEKPKLKLPELRYGVPASAILKCNDLEHSKQLSAPIARKFLYISPSDYRDNAKVGAGGKTSSRSTIEELTDKLKKCSPNYVFKPSDAAPAHNITWSWTVIILI